MLHLGTVVTSHFPLKMSKKVKRFRSSFDQGYVPSSRHERISPGRRHRRTFSERFGNRSFNSGNEYSSPRHERISPSRGRKRTLSERFGNSSFNSDNEYSSPAKFRKFEDYDTPSKYRGRTDPHPTFLGYQLVGDSLLLRFAEQILFRRCIYNDGLRYLGLCVSGQTIQELTQRVESKFSPLGERIVLLIGTNNMLRDHDIKTMKASLEELLTVLLKTTRKVVMLTLPPIPKLENNENFWNKLNEYNSFVIQLSKKYSNVFVEDISDLYLNENQECDMDYFERWFDKFQRRPDRIHLNKSGLVRLRERLWRCETMKDENQDEKD